VVTLTDVETEQRISELIEAADMNGLLRVIDGLAAAADWERLLDLADLCEDAVERGKQLWPIAAHVDYRIALEAPGNYAGGVIPSDLERFMLGPLTEVVASRHTWAEISPYVEPPHSAYVAQERVLRGEILDDDLRANPEALQLPLHLEPWEPTYALATYRSNVVEVAEAWEPRAPLQERTPIEADVLEEPDLEAALVELVYPWTNESNGAAMANVVEGSAEAAISTITPDAFRIGRLDVAEAMQRMAWAASSGGAYGRRRGAALGRSLAWHTAALLTDMPPGYRPEELVDGLSRLHWYRWDEGGPEEGWVFRLAVEDPENGWSAAIGATDLLEEDA
jgi:hypothetical protein